MAFIKAYLVLPAFLVTLKIWLNYIEYLDVNLKVALSLCATSSN
jgi:hypothetical protein